MKRSTDLFISIRRMMKLFESMLKEVCERHELTQIEANIISFLENNPGKDTAGDIVELRMLSKGNVSQAVESLIQKGFLRREQDEEDRRKIHLFLLPEADPVIEDIERVREAFHKQVFFGFTQEEWQAYAAFNDRIMENIRHTGEFEDRRKNI